LIGRTILLIHYLKNRIGSGQIFQMKLISFVVTDWMVPPTRPCFPHFDARRANLIDPNREQFRARQSDGETILEYLDNNYCNYYHCYYANCYNSFVLPGSSGWVNGLAKEIVVSSSSANTLCAATLFLSDSNTHY